MNPELIERIKEEKLIAVLVINRLEDAVPIAKALLKGGVRIMELTLRTPVAMDALREVREHVPDMLAGIGTILNVEQVQAVKEAGAAFGVSPGVNPKVLTEAQRIDLPFGPGVVTPTDVEQALEFGCRLLKFFPAGVMGGLKYLQAMAAPYNHLGVSYIPLGGINSENMVEYLDSPLIAAIGGSWIASPPLIAEQDWDGITRNAEAARAKI